MSKGDFVEVVYRMGDVSMTERVEAVKSGRTIDVEAINEHRINWIVVKELTRGGTVVRYNQYASSEVLAIRSQIKSDE